MTEVNYEMSEILRESIVVYCDVIKSLITTDLSIFLFGSVAKGKFFKNSDIDLLVIVKGKELSVSERRVYRLLVMGETWDYPEYKELDCKVYGEIDFNKISTNSFFEKSIKKDLIEVTDWG